MKNTYSVPRIAISSPSSSSGKTTVTCALLKLLPNVAAIKFGPDFIDPLFHQKVLGRKTGNIDLFFTDEDTARAIFAHDTTGADIVVCEGAMGYYDGADGTERASAYATARTLGCPVILVVDVKGKSLSVCAEINGFASFREKNGDRSGICGVILNRCSASLYEKLAPLIQKECDLRPLGFLEQNADFAIESRHLGLVTPDAVSDLQKKIEVLTEAARKSLDIEKIKQIAFNEVEVISYNVDFFRQFYDRKNEYSLVTVQKSRRGDANSIQTTDSSAQKSNPSACSADKSEKIRIAVAKDEAFCFYYQENLDLLEAFGAELVPFSPLRDKLIPAGCNALYLGGGYPELFPVQLAENTTMLQSVRMFCRSGAPVFAECGGFLYLKLAGILAGTFENKKKLVRFGYITLTANEDTLLCKKGDSIRAHEFHYFDTTENGSAFTAQKPNGTQWQCIQSAVPVKDMRSVGCENCAGGCGKCAENTDSSQKPTIFAGFPHLYFPSNPVFAQNFVRAAQEFAKRKKSGCANCAKKGKCHD